uniref:DUF4585 domain-containing protein n=1 Tax=Oreochromis niloticus TaxID=8128 RepID=A0A669BF49_ORENI
KSQNSRSCSSSGGSFLDENDREVCSLTDRAFRSLCIGDEAVYNDSDLSLSSPCTQRDRQLAFSQSGQDREDGEREELKRAACENFSLKVQQYGQDWSHGRMYGGEIHRDPQWEVYGERTQGRISATFQHSVVETSQKEKSLKEERLNFLSNGATESSSQQRKSNSRVSSLIRAFNSERHRDGVGMDDKIREWKDDTSWDKSALMSIQRELSEFSSYQQNFHSGHFPSSGPFSYGDTNLHSFGSDVAAVSHSSASSFMRSSHNKQSMFTQVSCNSNVFIHSEFSPFKVWRDHNRFPFQQGQISGFMHCSEFAKWYETPMYKEPSQMGQPQGHYTGIRQPRSNLAPMISPALPRSTSTSTVLQNASAVEKRCESELAGHYPHRKRSQSVGTNRLPSHRPSTASPTIEMSRRVRDTISSVKALQQKIKMMTEQNITTEVTENQQTVLYRNENVSLGNNAVTVAPNTIGSNTSATPFNISQLLTPLVHAHQEAVSSDLQHYATSPQPVEHPPVRAESRGATPDIRMSTYKSRATSLLFNLKDNRKRVKSTYSPTKFKAAETPEKNKQPPTHEPRDTVIDIPEFPDSEIQFSQLQESSRTSAAMNQYRSPELSLTMSNSQPVMATTGQYAEYSLSDYQRAQMQAQMVHHSGFTGFLPENYTGNKLANGQNLHEDLASFAPYRQDTVADVGTLGGALYTHKPPYSQQRRAAHEEQQRRAAHEEQQRKAAQEEQQRRAAHEEQQRIAEEEKQRVAEELKRRAAQEEQQRRAAQEEQQRRAAQEEQQRRAAQEEQQRRAAQEEQQRRAAQEEQQSRAAQEEQQRRASQEEQQRRAAQEELKRRSVHEEQLRIAQEEKQRIVEEQQRRAAQEEQQRKAAQEEQQRRAVQEEQQRRAAQEEQQRRAAQEEQQRRAVHEEQLRIAQEKQRAAEELKRRAAQEEQQRKTTQEKLQRAAEEELQMKVAQREQQRRAVQEIQQRRRAALIEEQRQIEEKILANTEADKKRKPREGDKVMHISEEEMIEQIQIEEQKRLRQKKEEWIRTQKREAEMRAVERVNIIKEEKQANERPKLHENNVESFATSAADLADIRGLYDNERPESACSFSSDVSRSLGKPPAVPPKSEKALRRAQRLTTRRMKKELSKVGADSLSAVEKDTVAHVPSSPTFHQANHPAPVTQYHVESSYPQAYPLTQRKVLQDPGSGQYFVVDLPVQVKKKTFFDPQTGKYIQLNVRESGKSISQPQPQQTWYHQHYQPPSINSLHPNKSQIPATLHQNQQPGCQAFELGQNSEGHRYSPEKTPYMDTVNDKDKTYNTIYSTHGSYESFPECDTNSQLAGSSVCENDNSAHSQHHPRDIIAMSELDDFMEVSDW